MLNNKGEFIKFSFIADGISAPVITLLVLTAGAHILLVNHENKSEKNSNVSAATNQQIEIM